MPIRVTGTGPKVEAKHKYGAEIPPQRKGEHLWVAVAMYRVRPENDQHFLDTENLLTIDGPGCYWCERPYTPELAAKPCPGDQSQ